MSRRGSIRVRAARRKAPSGTMPRRLECRPDAVPCGRCDPTRDRRPADDAWRCFAAPVARGLVHDHGRQVGAPRHDPGHRLRAGRTARRRHPRARPLPDPRDLCSTGRLAHRALADGGRPPRDQSRSYARCHRHGHRRRDGCAVRPPGPRRGGRSGGRRVHPAPPHGPAAGGRPDARSAHRRERQLERSRRPGHLRRSGTGGSVARRDRPGRGNPFGRRDLRLRRRGHRPAPRSRGGPSALGHRWRARRIRACRVGHPGGGRPAGTAPDHRLPRDADPCSWPAHRAPRRCVDRVARDR